MTEQQWLVCTDLEVMLLWLRGQMSARKRRLFAAACLRRIAHLFPDSRCLQSVVVAERYADGLATKRELDAAHAEAEAAYTANSAHHPAADAARRVTLPTVNHYLHSLTSLAAAAVAWGFLPPANALPANTWLTAQARETATQVSILRDLVGNPFRPVPVRPAWKTSPVVALARCIYEEGRFDELPILGDALMEAGCQEDAILDHCREPGPHVRGCWLLDRLLAKQ